MSKKLRIGIIFGGRSQEHEVSLVSASSIIKALDKKIYDVVEFGISKKGEWFTGKNVAQAFKKGSLGTLKKVSLDLNTSGEIGGHKLDVVFPVLHGPYGEDGTMQGFFEVLDIPYIGCGVFASSAGMDKYMMKMVFKAFDLPQVNFLHFGKDEIKQALTWVPKKLGFPCFVKPCNLGSSVGVSKVKKMSELLPALKLAAKYDPSIMVEEGIDAREIECSVLGNKNLKVSVPGEIVPNREFYDYYAKYVDNASKLFIPAPLTAAQKKTAQDYALRAFRALQGSGMARVDFLMDRKTGKMYINEVNTIPGFTSISMYPKLWEASGLSYAKLLDALVKLALERHEEKKKNILSFESGSDWYTS